MTASHPTAADNILAIQRLISAYCDAVKRQDADAAGSLFAPDAIIKIADFPQLEGREAITAGMKSTFSNFSFMHQSCDTGLIDVEGDRARARLDVFEANNRLGKEGVQIIFGTYEDEYVLLNKGWRFFRRRFTIQARAMMPVTKFQAFPASPTKYMFSV